MVNLNCSIYAVNHKIQTINVSPVFLFRKYKTRKTDYVSGCCMLIKKELIDQLEGFNENYEMYYE